MPTRHAPEGSPLSQERWSSSPAFTSGILANLAARRITLVEDRARRELLWWLQKRSYHPDGLSGLVSKIVGDFRARLGPVGFEKLAHLKALTPEQVATVRDKLPKWDRERFLLRGEFTEREALDKIWDDYAIRIHEEESGRACERRLSDSERRANQRPEKFTPEDFLRVFTDEALGRLSERLSEAVLNPELAVDPTIDDAGLRPWYCAALPEILTEMMERERSAARSAIGQTAITAAMESALEDTWLAGGFSLIAGEDGSGKTTAARNWCDQHPGRARYVATPATNHRKDFFREIALALGCSVWRGAKAAELQERIETTLRTGDLMLVFDSASHLWPNTNLREAMPDRIDWIVAHLVERGIPVAIVAGPDFFARMEAIQLRSGWSPEPLRQRLAYTALPALSKEDYRAVVETVFPQAPAVLAKHLATYTATQIGRLHSLRHVSLASKAIARRQGRDTIEAADIQAAVTQVVMPAAVNFSKAIEAAAPKRSRAPRAVPPVLPDESPLAGDLPDIGRGAAVAPQRPGSLAADTDFAPAANRREMVPAVATKARRVTPEPVPVAG